MHAFRHLFLPSVIALSVLLAGALTGSRAQVMTDGSLGAQMTLTGPRHTIGHELGEIRGRNLFHSFHDFNIKTGESANFTGPSTINNIINRVTGGNPSFINGALRSDIDGANLFLLNPNGLMFGAEARLDITGSLHVSTAEALHFADGKRWLTGNPAAGGLSVATPSAFGFLVDNPAGIAIEGSRLDVPVDKELSIIGGDLIISGGELIAPHGRIQLTSVGTAGDVPAPQADASGTYDMDHFARMGDIRLTDQAIIDSTGEGGGTVTIRGGNLVIDRAFVGAETRGASSGGIIDVAIRDHMTVTGGSFDGKSSGLSTTTRTESATGDAGDIRISAAIVEMMDNTRIQSRNRDQSTGDAGTVVMQVGELIITERGQVSASARDGRGAAGSVTVTATDRVTIIGNNTGLSVDSNNRGQAGQIALTAPTVTLRDGGRIRARNDHRRATAGRIHVNAQRLELIDGGHIETSAGHRRGEESAGAIFITVDSLIISGPDSGVASVTSGRGNAGLIRIDTDTMALTGGAQISAAALRRSEGSGGIVQIVATGHVLITGDGMPGRLPGNVTDVTQDEGVSAGTWGTGDAGGVMIEAPTVEMRGRALIHARSRAGSSGNAGEVNLEVGQLTLLDRAQISASSQSEEGAAGRLNIHASASVRITGRNSRANEDFTGFSISNRGEQSGGVMTVSTPTLVLEQGGQLRSKPNDLGGGGRINVLVDQLQLTEGGQISNTTQSSSLSDGGLIDVTARERITISGEESGITSTTQGDGNGGAIRLTTPALMMSDSGILVSDSVKKDGGNAGDIVVAADRVMLTNGARISTIAQGSNGGDIRLTATRTVGLQDSTITASVEGDARTTGGNITLDSELVTLLSSQVTTQASDNAQGGNIQIIATGYLADINSVVDASSSLGIDGTVDIQTISDLSGDVIPLTADFMRPHDLLQNQCAVPFQAGAVSSLVQRDRSGIPATPGGFLPGLFNPKRRALAHP